jgi:hypothetical protein
MRDSNVADTKTESEQAEFSHGLQDVCATIRPPSSAHSATRQAFWTLGYRSAARAFRRIQ